MSFRIGDLVIVNKDITRVEGPYALKGDFGIVVDIFNSGFDVNDKRTNAKVQMSTGEIKTFRLTSLDKASEWGF